MLKMIIAGVILNIASIHAYGASVRDSRLESVSKSQSGELNAAYLTIMGFTIGTDSIEDVRSQLGPADKKHRENGSTEICYVSSDPKDQTRVIFITGALGGWKTLVAFQVISKEAWDDTPTCFPSAKVSKAVSAGDALRFGVSIDDLQKPLGVATDHIGDLVRWSYKGKQKMTQGERDDAEKTFKKYVADSDAYFDTMSGIDVSQKGSKVTSFAVYRIASY